MDPADLVIPARAAPAPAPPPRRHPVWTALLLAVVLAVLTPPAVVLALRWIPPPTTAFMLQSPVKPVRYDWVPAERIAEAARKAVIAAEDQKFWTHNGFDFEAIEKAYWQNQKRRGRRGASTISQQTAKNLFLWPGRSWLRKGVEVSFTVLIEFLWPKERILEIYLNVAEFGPGIYGVEAAAQAFFRKSAAQLTPNEAARLAAVLPNPQRWKAASPGPYVQARSAWILGQLGYRSPARPAPVEEPIEPLLSEPDVVSPPMPEPEVATEPGIEVPEEAVEPTEPTEPTEAAPAEAEPAPEAEPESVEQP